MIIHWLPAVPQGSEEFPLSRRKSSIGQQVGAELRRTFQTLLSAPLANLGMVPREQHLGNIHTAEVGRARVLGILEQVSVKALVYRPHAVAENPGDLPDHGIDDHHGRQLA